MTSSALLVVDVAGLELTNLTIEENSWTMEACLEKAWLPLRLPPRLKMPEPTRLKPRKLLPVPLPVENEEVEFEFEAVEL